MSCSNIVAMFIASLGLLSGVISIISRACSKIAKFISYSLILVIFRQSWLRRMAVDGVVSSDKMKRALACPEIGIKWFLFFFCLFASNMGLFDR